MEDSARVHEFGSSVALKVGDNQTIYLSLRLAEALSRELAIAADQIRHGYHYGTVEV